MSKISGIVEEIVSRNGYYDLKINGKRYGNGKYAPRDVKQGDFVEFEYESKQNGQYTNYYVKPRTLRKAEGSTPAKAPEGAQESATTSGYAQPVKREYVAFDERQDIISRQAALNTALQFCTLASSHGAVDFPKSAKPSERLTLVRAWLLDEASRFYNLSTGRKWEMPEQEPAALPQDRRSKAKAAASEPETSDTDTGSNEFPDDDIPF